MNISPLEKMALPQPSPGGTGDFNYRGVPSNPRNLRAIPGSGQCTIKWSPPGDSRGVDSYRVYGPAESTLIQSIADNELTQFVLKMSSSTSQMVYVSCLSALGRESNKMPLLVSSM